MNRKVTFQNYPAKLSALRICNSKLINFLYFPYDAHYEEEVYRINRYIQNDFARMGW